jgi:uncharacterized protein involved in response to NO
MTRRPLPPVIKPPAPAAGAQAEPAVARYGLLALGFRPFFLVAGGWAALSLIAWLAVLFGLLAPPRYLAGTHWHAHEMLFGYTAAVIAGFLLTAARNWSGLPTAAGGRLAALVALWLAARLAPWLGAPAWLIGALDIAFFPALALSLRRALWQGPNPVNRLFLVVFGGFTLASLLVNLDGMGVLPGLAARGQRLMLDLVIVLMLVVGGRVMPFFTRAAIPGAAPVSRPWLDKLVFGAVLAMLALHLALPSSPLAGRLAGVAALAAGVLLLARLAGWHDRRAWGLPMLAVLYLGFLWLAAGLILDGIAAFRLLPPSIALHAITAGAIGTLTLGMMARVTLGHTGRAMHASRLTLLAFALVTVAALLRSIAVWLAPGLYTGWMLAAGTCWIGAFALFTAVYAPMLIAPRVDGKPG